MTKQTYWALFLIDLDEDKELWNSIEGSKVGKNSPTYPQSHDSSDWKKRSWWPKLDVETDQRYVYVEVEE